MALPPDHDLEALRGEVDRLDGAIVELLAERMAVVGEIARVKRLGRAAAAGPAIRPAREAVILRRLVERAAGRLPAGTLVRMWRELLAASTRAQAPLAVAVHVPADQPGLWDLARDHFGSLTPIQRTESASQALRALALDPTRLAVLPLPDERQGWWASLLEGAPHPLRVVARLPFARTEPEAGDALVVAALEPEPSGDDATLVGIETRRRDDLSRGRLVELLAAAGLGPRWLAATAPAGDAGPIHLVELAGYLGPGEPRLTAALAAAREHVLRAAWLGGYARPLAAAT
jgi:chorismate mutase